MASLERKRSKGAEELGAKRQRLEDSPLSDQEIAIHASYDEDEFLSYPVGVPETDVSEGRSRPEAESPPDPIREDRETASDSDPFPLSKARSVGDKRKERRYRGVVDSSVAERHVERARSKYERRSASPSYRSGDRGLKAGTMMRSGSLRASPHYREERERRERQRKRERELRDSRYHEERHLVREPSLKRRSDEVWEREDSRRGAFQHERLYPRELSEERRREPLPRRDERRERELRERLLRNERYSRRSKSPRPRSDRLPERLERPVRLGPRGEGGERGGRREDYRAGEKHRHKRSKHQRHNEREEQEKTREKVEKETVIDTDSEESEAEVPELTLEVKIDEEKAEEEREEEVSSEASGSSKEEEGGGGASHSEGEDSRSELSEDDSLEKQSLGQKNTVSKTELEVLSSSGSEDQSPVVRSKFDTSPVAENQVRRGYSGYGVAMSESEESEREEEREEAEEEEEEEEVEPEMERSPSPELPNYFPALMGCRSVENYEWLNRIEEGTYGVVYRARDKRSGDVVALKKLKMEKEKEGFPITSLREINMLLKAKHPNIVHVREIVVGSNMDRIFIVMDYVEHDLKSLMETMKQPFLQGEVKTLMLQLLRAVHHLHDNWILHRDLKASNLLLSHKGILKVGDFGLAREYGSPLRPYTPVVVTLWYRSPELLLGAKEYSTAVDMWSVGCIFAEFLLHKALFRGKSEIDQLNQIFKELGTPSETIWPGYNQLPIAQKVTFAKQPLNHLRKKFPYLTSNGFDLLNRLLTYDPKKRITAEQALEHIYFKESPLPVDPSMFPTWPARSEMARRPRERSPTAPEGGAFLLNQHDADEEAFQGGFRLTQAQHGQAAVGAGFSLRF